MKLLQFKKVEDFGTEWYVFFLKGRKTTVIQGSVGWCEAPSHLYVQITTGANSLFGFFFMCHKFSFNIDIFGRTYTHLD